MNLRLISRCFGVLVLMLAILVALPVVSVETACRQPPSREASSERQVSLGITALGYRRPETNSYLSYPEWAIVYAYQDLAGVMRDKEEYGFDYLASIGGFWTSLCGVNRIASARGGSEFSEKAMLYVIGASFTAEMALKGAYETTLGRLTAWLRGPERTGEDLFARRVAEDYARFLQQVPWYDYPFGIRLRQLWREVPFTASSPVRAGERRLALTLEWSAKAAYAKLIRLAASLAPAELRIGSVVRDLDTSDVAADPRITVIRDLGEGGFTLIETPRYGEFTSIVAGLAGRGRQLVEIAGNRSVLATALVPARAEIDTPGAREIFSGAVQSRPGWRRLGLDVAVPQLTDLVRTLQAQGAVFEHVYDY